MEFRRRFHKEGDKGGAMRRRIVWFTVFLIALGMYNICLSQDSDWQQKGNIYTSNKYGCAIEKPEGWTIKILEGKLSNPLNVFMVQMFSPDFDAHILFVAQKNINNLNAEEAIKVDITQIKANKQIEFNLITGGATIVDGYSSAHQIVDEIRYGDTTYTQRRIYVSTKDYIYAIIFNAIGEGSYSKYKNTFQEILESVRLP